MWRLVVSSCMLRISQAAVGWQLLAGLIVDLRVTFL